MIHRLKELEVDGLGFFMLRLPFNRLVQEGGSSSPQGKPRRI